jgi:hypothetical protein
MLAIILQVAGSALIALGAGLIFPPLGIILAGAGALVFGIALERK